MSSQTEVKHGAVKRTRAASHASSASSSLPLKRTRPNRLASAAASTPASSPNTIISMEDDGAVADSDSSSDSDLDLTREEIQEMAREWMLNDSTFRQIFILRGTIKRTLQETKAFFSNGGVLPPLTVNDPSEAANVVNPDEKMTVKFAFHDEGLPKIFQLSVLPDEPFLFMMNTLRTQPELHQKKFNLKFDGRTLIPRKCLADYDIEDGDQVDIELD